MDKRNRTRTAVVIFAIAAVVLAGVGIGWWLGRSGTQAPPPTSTARTTSADTTGGDVDGVCGLPVGSQDVPRDAPEAKWEIRRQLTVPSAPDYGPGKVEAEDRSCFAHNPMGAVFFILNFQSLEPDKQADHMVEPSSPGTEASTSASGDVLTVRGFQATPQGPDKVELKIAYSLNNGPLFAVSGTTAWIDGDWKVDLAAPNTGGREDLDSLDGFVQWGPQ